VPVIEINGRWHFLDKVFMSDIIGAFIAKKENLSKKYKRIIEEMLGESENRYDYAYDTLSGILDYIEENDAVTPAQITAIENIQAKPSNRYGW
jgi:hypothetical protein